MSSATPKEPSSSESSSNSSTPNRNDPPKPFPGGNPKHPIFLNIPPPLKAVDGEGNNGVTTFDTNFSAIKGKDTNTTTSAAAGKAPLKLNHQLSFTDCSNGCMPAYVLSSMVGVMVIAAVLSIFVTLKRRRQGREVDPDETAINSFDIEDAPRFIAEKNPPPSKHFTYRSSSLADIGSPNGLRRRSELGSPFAVMSELNKPFMFSKNPPMGCQLSQQQQQQQQQNQATSQIPQRPSPAPPLVIPRSSEEIYAAYTSGLALEEETLPSFGFHSAGDKPVLVSPQPRSLKSIALDNGSEHKFSEYNMLGKKDSPTAPLDFTMLIPDPSATPTANEFEIPALIVPENASVTKKHDIDSDDDLVDCWNPELVSSKVKKGGSGGGGGSDGDDDDDDDEEDDNVFFMPQAFNVDEQVIPHDDDLSLQKMVEEAAARPDSKRSNGGNSSA